MKTGNGADPAVPDALREAESAGISRDPAERFRRNNDYICRTVAGESILVPTGEAALQFCGMGAMNSTASFLWGLLEEERSFSDLCGRFAAEYGLTEQQSREDVTDFLALALDHNLVMTCGKGECASGS